MHAVPTCPSPSRPAGRVFLGFGVGMANQVVPLYLSEMAPFKYRCGTGPQYSSPCSYGQAQVWQAAACTGVIPMSSSAPPNLLLRLPPNSLRRGGLNMLFQLAVTIGIM